MLPSPPLVCGFPGKVIASRLSLSLACHPVSPPSWIPGGEKGHGRPTEAAKVEVLARWRSQFLCLSLRLTGVYEEPVSRVKTQAGKFKDELDCYCSLLTAIRSIYSP